MAEEQKKTSYEFSIAGFKLKLNNTIIAMAIPIATTIGGGMWGVFEFYQDYMDMRHKIEKYVAPDLTDFDKRLAVIEQNSSKTTDYTRDIKNDLKSDIRRNESVTEQVERSVKQSQREIDQDLRLVRNEMEQLKRNTESRMEKLSSDIDRKIQKALDNPLANK